MHIPSFKPACWVSKIDLIVPDDMAAFWDGGRSCGNFKTAEDEKAALILTPGCRGCARAARARSLRTKK
jgi:hypothetical protein